MLLIILTLSIIQLSTANHAGSRLLNSASDSVNDHLPTDYNNAGSRSLLSTEAERVIAERVIAVRFAPVLRFDRGATSNSNGFPTIYNNGKGRESNQNMKSDIYGIPTYFKVFRNDPSDKLRITSIGYYWYYEYQSSCLIDTVIPNEINNLPAELTDVLGLGDITSAIIPSEWAGAHNDDLEHIIVNIDTDHILRSVTYYQHGGSYTVRNEYVDDLGTINNGQIMYDKIMDIGHGIDIGQIMHYFTVPTALTISDTTHAHVFIGRTAHGSFHNILHNVGGCGWFADYRDGHFTLQSLYHLKPVSWEGEILSFDEFEKDYLCDDTGCNWDVCETRDQMENNWELCTPLECKAWSTPCLPWGVSNIVKSAADINDKIFRLYDTDDPNCSCVDVPLIGDVCVGENIEGQVCLPISP